MSIHLLLVPNAPCGVESHWETQQGGENVRGFLMHRVELKETLGSGRGGIVFLFLMHRVELKGL